MNNETMEILIYGGLTLGGVLLGAIIHWVTYTLVWTIREKRDE